MAHAVYSASFRNAFKCFAFTFALAARTFDFVLNGVAGAIRIDCPSVVNSISDSGLIFSKSRIGRSIMIAQLLPCFTRFLIMSSLHGDGLPTVPQWSTICKEDRYIAEINLCSWDVQSRILDNFDGFLRQRQHQRSSVIPIDLDLHPVSKRASSLRCKGGSHRSSQTVHLCVQTNLPILRQTRAFEDETTLICAPWNLKRFH